MKITLGFFSRAIAVTCLVMGLARAQVTPRDPPPKNSLAPSFPTFLGPKGQNPPPGSAGQPNPFGLPPPGSSRYPQGKIPITGQAGPGLEPLDRALCQIMDRHGIPGGGLAIAKDGKLVYAKGFGWADLANGVPVRPQTTFGLASLSKPITAVATLLLVERGQLALDDLALYHLRHIHPPRGVPMDPRLKEVTIRQLLNHTGGWDRNITGDPVNWSPQIARAFNTSMPISSAHFISFMMGVPLNFNPGSKWSYSNVGYMFLQEIIQKVAGQPYEEFVLSQVFKPMGIKSAFMSTSRRDYLEGEAHCYIAGTTNEVTPMNLPMAKAAAGWTADATDMVRFMTALDGSRGKMFLKEGTYAAMVSPPVPPLPPRPNKSYPGLGWTAVIATPKGYDYFHDGNWFGMRTFMKRHSARGTNVVLLFNVSVQADSVDNQIMLDAAREVAEHVEKIKEFPKVDFFRAP